MFRDVVSILRLHIIGVAMCAAIVFGWLLTGRFHVDIALVGGLDWMLINLLNRMTDLKEDLANQIRGTTRVAARKSRFWALWWGLFIGSFGWTVMAYPELTWWRALVQLIGLGYSLPMAPTLAGLRRFKNLYFLKNFMSAVLFVLTVFIYPVEVSAEITHPAGTLAVVVLVLFFVPFELTYEILYDLRDLEGDRLAGVPTYPVVHGPVVARRIIDSLLFGASAVLLAALAAGLIGVLEGLMLAAPLLQFLFYRPRYSRGLTSEDCIWLTHLGSGMLLLYLAGTQLWLAAGLPSNVYLVGP